MFKGVNRVLILGILGIQPDVRYMPSGKSVTSLSIATNESWKSKVNGEIQSKTEWHRVVLYDRLSEIAKEYLKKGSKVYIEGSLRTNKWQDKSGVTKYMTEIIASRIQLIDNKDFKLEENISNNDTSSLNIKDEYKNNVFDEKIPF